MVKYKEWDEYGQILTEIMTQEVYIILAFFGNSHKFLKEVQQMWFKSRDLKKLKLFLDVLSEKHKSSEIEPDRDELTLWLRLSVICDVFANCKNLYKWAKNLMTKNLVKKGDQLTLICNMFKKYYLVAAKYFLAEEAIADAPKRYAAILYEIRKKVIEYSELDDFEKLIEDVYQVNEMISDLLELLEEDPNDTGKFSSESEVTLYEFAIFYSTLFYFSLLLFEKITDIEEKESATKKNIWKPILEENEARVAEAQMTGVDGEQLFYNILKN